MRSNKQVVGTDHHPTYLQLGTNLRIMRSRFVGEIEKLDITQKGVEGRLTLLPPRRLFNAAPSLRLGDYGNARVTHWLFLSRLSSALFKRFMT